MVVFLQRAAICSVLLLVVQHFLRPSSPPHWYFVHSFVPTTTTTMSSLRHPRFGMIRSFPSTTTKKDDTNMAARVSRLYSTSKNAVVNGNQKNYNNQSPKKGNIIVVGATGYIGKAVVRECLRQNYQTFAFVRKELTKDVIDTDFTYQSQSAIPIVCDVTNQTQVLEQMKHVQTTYCKSTSSSSSSDDPNTMTAVVSCLASRSGVKKDAYLIDYQATYHCLQSAIATQTQHFILLSAFCVQKPLLQFQQGTFSYFSMYCLLFGDWDVSSTPCS